MCRRRQFFARDLKCSISLGSLQGLYKNAAAPFRLKLHLKFNINFFIKHLEINYITMFNSMNPPLWGLKKVNRT